MRLGLNFLSHQGNYLGFLISNHFEENLISTRVVEKIQQNEQDQIYCGYYEEDFAIQLTMGQYEDSVECKVSSENCGVIFGKPWIAERHAMYDEEACMLKLFNYGLRYGRITLPQ